MVPKPLRPSVAGLWPNGRASAKMLTGLWHLGPSLNLGFLICKWDKV